MLTILINFGRFPERETNIEPENGLFQDWRGTHCVHFLSPTATGVYRERLKINELVHENEKILHAVDHTSTNRKN